MIKTILVPTDGSEHANKAVTLAADISEKYDARMVLLHVMNHGPLPEAWRHMAEVENLTGRGARGVAQATADVPKAKFPASMSSGETEPTREVLEYFGQRVLRSAEDIAKTAGVKALDTALEDGDPVKQILSYADKESANLIVMGSRGLGDLKGLLMGSVSHKVSHLAPCTCVTVK